MNTELRDWYLSSLDVSQYLPKIEPADDSNHYSIKNNKNEGKAEEQAGLTGRALNANKSLEEKKATISSPKEPLKKNAASAGLVSSLKFNLVCWQPCDELLVLSGLDFGIKPSGDQCLLVANVCRAIGHFSGELPAPCFHNGQVERNGDDDEGRFDVQKILSPFIGSCIQHTSGFSLLIMGEAAFKLFASTEESYLDLKGKTIQVKNVANTFVLNGLEEILTDPLVKLDTWRTIKPLLNKA